MNAVCLWQPAQQRPAAYYLACLVRRQLKIKFDIVLPVVELLKIRSVLMDMGLYLPFGLIRAFFSVRGSRNTRANAHREFRFYYGN